MAVEAFHRLLKVCYMEKKQNRRMDKLLHSLLKIAWDKIFERVPKTQKVRQLNKRHKMALETMLLSSVSCTSSFMSWTVKSKSTSKSYTVDRLPTKCFCRLCCNSCKICIHSFSCNCMDFILHATICKHIHLVNLHLESSIEISPELQGLCKTPSSSSDTGPPVNELEPQDTTLEPQDTTEAMSVEAPTGPDMSSVQYLSNCLGNAPVEQYQCAKEKAISICKQIEVALFESNDIDAITTGTKHLNAALIVIKGVTSNRQRCDPEFPVRKDLLQIRTVKGRYISNRLKTIRKSTQNLIETK